MIRRKLRNLKFFKEVQTNDCQKDSPPHGSNSLETKFLNKREFLVQNKVVFVWSLLRTRQKKYEQERKVVEETSSCIFFCLCSVVVSFLIFKLNYTEMYKIEQFVSLGIGLIYGWGFFFPRFIDKMTIKQPTRSTPSKTFFPCGLWAKKIPKKTIIFTEETTLKRHKQNKT